MTASFFRRVVYQLKQTWIFFQMDYMHYFNEFLQHDICNNSLMKGLMDNASGDSYAARKLKVSQDQLRSIVTTIVGKFVKLYQDNPMSLLETLFRYQSKEIKDQVLCNYNIGTCRVGLVDKEAEAERERQISGAYDENIVFGEEKVVFETGEQEEAEHMPVDKHQWTQKQDDVLIDNYQTFATMEKKSRFTFLAELVGGGKTYKDCYKRAKLLKLKNGTLDEAKGISHSLLSEQAGPKNEQHQRLKKKLVAEALEKLKKDLEGENVGIDNNSVLEKVTDICHYLCQI